MSADHRRWPLDFAACTSTTCTKRHDCARAIGADIAAKRPGAVMATGEDGNDYSMWQTYVHIVDVDACDMWWPLAPWIAQWENESS